jgi:hypothetical protein
MAAVILPLMDLLSALIMLARLWPVHGVHHRPTLAAFVSRLNIGRT